MDRIYTKVIHGTGIDASNTHQNTEIFSSVLKNITTNSTGVTNRITLRRSLISSRGLKNIISNI